MTDETVDLRVDQEIVVRLRTYAHIAHAAASWGFSGDGFWMDRGADMIEEQAAEIDQLREALERIKANTEWAEEGREKAMVIARKALARIEGEK